MTDTDTTKDQPVEYADLDEALAHDLDGEHLGDVLDALADDLAEQGLEPHQVGEAVAAKAAELIAPATLTAGVADELGKTYAANAADKVEEETAEEESAPAETGRGIRALIAYGHSNATAVRMTLPDIPHKGDAFRVLGADDEILQIKVRDRIFVTLDDDPEYPDCDIVLICA